MTCKIISPPTGLSCQLLTAPEKTDIRTAFPVLGWIMQDDQPNSLQTAYQILFASTLGLLNEAEADMWNSGKVLSNASINVKYAGKALEASQVCYWMVRIWNDRGLASGWSEPQKIVSGTITEAYETAYYPLEKSKIAPVEFVAKTEGAYFIDFGKDAFGTLQLTLSSPSDGHCVEVHLGEAIQSRHTVDRTPAGKVRYRKLLLILQKGTHIYQVQITPDTRNTGDKAILMPPEVGEVMPFRYCELYQVPQKIDCEAVRQIAVHYPFDDSAADFNSSDQTLNAVWDLCKYSIKATTFCGIYVDGDRERIPYEADAYLNQLCHYCTDREYSLARRSHEYLLFHPTWPTEWNLHSVLMAWADYEYTGNSDFLSQYYDELKAKTLTALAREDGLISTKSGLVTLELLASIHLDTPLQDIVDWPPTSFVSDGGKGERDGYDMVSFNTVVNAFHYRALVLMNRIAVVLGFTHDANFYAQRAEKVYEAINEKLFDHVACHYLDGEGSSHASLHANMLPLAFELVPPKHIPGVLQFVKSRGMACSVYGAQYLLEALYQTGADDYALELMTARHDRSWYNMLKIGSTITLEAWDHKYKNNLDWNHAWGAVPANIIPRFLMGVRPLEPGFGKFLIKPCPGGLTSAEATIPTIRGAVKIAFERTGDAYQFMFRTPANTVALVELPGGQRFELGSGSYFIEAPVTPQKHSATPGKARNFSSKERKEVNWHS